MNVSVCGEESSTLNNCTLNQLDQIDSTIPADIGPYFSREEVIYQIRATYHAVLGDEEGAQNIFDAGHLKYDKPQGDLSKNKGYSKKQPATIDRSIKTISLPAIPTIVEKAKHRRVVMLNEAHHISRHRVFAKNLAVALREVGFTHIAAETFSSNAQMKALVKRGYPTVDTGAYMNDPEFAQFIRRTHEVGYQFVNYESGGQGIAARETGQAENLARFIKKNPEARIFVYAGYAHIREKSSNASVKKSEAWMAERFASITGIDPLTIDQVGGTAHFEDLFTDQVYKNVEHQLRTDSVVFKEANTNNGWLRSDKYKRVDMTVFHPRTKFVTGKPEWLINDYQRRPYTVDAALIPGIRPITIRAFIDYEWGNSGNKAIPVDQQLLTEFEQEVTLYLPPGRYQIDAECLNNTKVKIGTIIVKES